MTTRRPQPLAHLAVRSRPPAPPAVEQARPTAGTESRVALESLSGPQRRLVEQLLLAAREAD